MNWPYMPPPYRPRLLPRAVFWTLMLVGSILFVCICIVLMWMLAAVLG